MVPLRKFGSKPLPDAGMIDRRGFAKLIHFPLISHGPLMNENPVVQPTAWHCSAGRVWRQSVGGRPKNIGTKFASNSSLYIDYTIMPNKQCALSTMTNEKHVDIRCDAHTRKEIINIIIMTGTQRHVLHD